MLPWRYLLLGTNCSKEETPRLIDKHLAPKIYQLAPGSECMDLDALVAELKDKADQFFAKTTVVDVWDHVPDHKKIRDWRYISAVIHHRNNFDTNLGTDQEMLDQANGKLLRPVKKSSPFPPNSGFAAFLDQLDEEREDLPMPPKTRDGGFAFIHALDTAVLFTEQEQYTQSQAASFLRELLRGEAVYNALYLKEMLDHPERMEWQRGVDPVELARRITQNYVLEQNLTCSHTKSFFKLNGEAEIAREFLRTKPKGLVLPHKLGVHAVDGQLGWRAWMTYEEIPLRTASNLSSIATYGLVAGGIAGWVTVPTQLMGTVDRADLCIMNYDTKHQGAVITPIEEYARPGFKTEFPYSIAVMVDGRKEGGIDIRVMPSKEGILPSIPPEGLVIVVPASLEHQITARINYFGSLLKRGSDETQATLSRGICYDPALWGDFHNFNEWLQTTPQGQEILEEKLGRRLSELKTVDDINRRLGG